MELRRLVQSYLHPKWILVAFGILTSILEILASRFQKQHIFLLHQYEAQTKNLYNTLLQQFKSSMRQSPPQNLVDMTGPSTVEAHHAKDKIGDGHETNSNEELEEERFSTSDRDDYDEYVF